MSGHDRNRLRFVAGIHYAKMVWEHRTTAKRAISAPEIVGIVRDFEAAGFDAFFVADFLGLDRAKLGRLPVTPFEPFTLLGAIATATERIGLIATASTMFEQPYNLARRFASLDHLSGGRAGWNAVTSFNGEQNFGFDQIPSPETRYSIGDEFIEVANLLWGSWAPGAVVTDPADPRYVDADRITDIHHTGPHFAVSEGLDIPASPQGRPVIFQAGASASGIAFAGRHAEAVFVAAPTLEHGKEFYRAVKAAAAGHGRHPDTIKVLPGLRVYIGATHAEAQRQFDLEITDELIESTRRKLAYEFPELDLLGLAIDQPIPRERLPALDDVSTAARRRSRIKLLIDFASRQENTFADFITFVSRSYGHLVMIGTADSVAEEIARWFHEDAADGFVLQGSGEAYGPFVDEVLPRLRQRGLWRPPEGRTLRENLGIGAPATHPASTGQQSIPA